MTCRRTFLIGALALIVSPPRLMAPRTLGRDEFVTDGIRVGDFITAPPYFVKMQRGEHLRVVAVTSSTITFGPMENS